MLSLPQLIYFNEVAKTLHFTKAADNLHIAQSGLSRAISTLESELGVPLFLRQRYKNVRLTAYGEALLPHVQRILSEIEESRNELEQMANPNGGKVRLIYSIFNGHSITKHCLQEFYRDDDLVKNGAGRPSRHASDPAVLPSDSLMNKPDRHQKIDVSIRINHGAISLPDEIATGSADLAISCYRPDDGSVNCQMIGMQQLYVTLPADHPLAARAEDTMCTASENNHFKTGISTSGSNIKSLMIETDAPDEIVADAPDSTITDSPNKTITDAPDNTITDAPHETASAIRNNSTVSIKKAKEISLEEIAGEKIILFSSSLSLYAWVMEAFAQSGLSPSFIDGFQDWSAIMMQVANGQGVSILPRVDFESNDTVQIPLAGDFGHRPVYLLSPNDRKLTPAVRSFKQYFLDFCQKHPEWI